MPFDPLFLQGIATAVSALASAALAYNTLRSPKDKEPDGEPGKHWEDKNDQQDSTEDEELESEENDGDTDETESEEADGSEGDSSEPVDGEEDAESAEADEAGTPDEEGGTSKESETGSEGTSSDAQMDSESDSGGSPGDESESTTDVDGVGSSASESDGNPGTGTESAQEAQGGDETHGTDIEPVESANASQGGSEGDASDTDSDSSNVSENDNRKPTQPVEAPEPEVVYDTALTLAALALAEEARQEEKERNAHGAVEEGSHIVRYVPAPSDDSQPGTGAGALQGRWNPPELRFYNSEWMQQIERILTHKMGIVKETKAVKKTYQRWSNKSNRTGGIIYPRKATLINRDSTLAAYVGVDTSGSMYNYNPNRVAEALDEILQKNLLDVRVACIDTVMRDWQEATTVKEILMEGGGGTQMSPFFEAVNAIADGDTDMPKPNLVVLLTDGELAWGDWERVTEESGRLAGRNIPVFILILDRRERYPDELTDVAHVHYV